MTNIEKEAVVVPNGTPNNHAEMAQLRIEELRKLREQIPRFAAVVRDLVAYADALAVVASRRLRREVFPCIRRHGAHHGPRRQKLGLHPHVHQAWPTSAAGRAG